MTLNFFIASIAEEGIDLLSKLLHSHMLLVARIVYGPNHVMCISVECSSILCSGWQFRRNKHDKSVALTSIKSQMPCLSAVKLLACSKKSLQTHLSALISIIGLTVR